jgi:hypothetical protein
VVAHLVLAHQTQMHNLITQTIYQTRITGKFEKPAEQLVRYLLFANAGGEPEHLAGDFVHRPGWRGEGDAFRLRKLRERRVQHAAQGRIHFDD